MWWLFELDKDEQNVFLYKYSRESKELDGMIEHDKLSQTTRVLSACRVDVDEDYVADAAIKFYHVIKAGFPVRKIVACG